MSCEPFQTPRRGSAVAPSQGKRDHQALPTTPSYFTHPLSPGDDVPDLGFDTTPLSNGSLPITPPISYINYRPPLRARSPASTSKFHRKLLAAASQPSHTPPPFNSSVPAPRSSFPNTAACNLSVRAVASEAVSISNLIATDVTDTSIVYNLDEHKLVERVQTHHKIASTINQHVSADFYAILAPQAEFQSTTIPTAITQYGNSEAIIPPPKGIFTFQCPIQPSAAGTKPKRQSTKPSTQTSFETNNTEANECRVCCFVRIADASENLARILPYDSVQRLLKIPDKCIVSNAKHVSNRCEHKVKGSSSYTALLLSRIAQAQDNCSLASATPIINLLLDQYISGSSTHKKIARDRFQDLVQCLAEHNQAGSGKTLELASKCFSLEDIAAVPGWLAALTLTSTIQHETAEDMSDSDAQIKSLPRSTGRPSHLRDLSVDVEIDYKPNTTKPSPSKHRNKTRSASANIVGDQSIDKSSPKLLSSDTAIRQGFIQFVPSSKTRSLSIKDALRYQLTLPFNLKERDITGHVYVYWTRGNFGYVKIGVTKRSVDERLMEWKRKCGHDIESHKISNEEKSAENLSTMLIPHVYRVEKLVHTELRQQRRVESKCLRCGCKHDEWFCVDPEHAKKVVLKWARWMTERQEVYKVLLGEDKGFELAEIIDDHVELTWDEDNKQDDTPITETEIDSICTPLEPSLPSARQSRRSSQIRSLRSRTSNSVTIPRRSPRNHKSSINPTRNLALKTQIKIKTSVSSVEVKSVAAEVPTNTIEANAKRPARDFVTKDDSKARLNVALTLPQIFKDISTAVDDSNCSEEETTKLLNDIAEAAVHVSHRPIKLEDAS